MDKVFAWLKSRTAAQFVFAVILLLGTFARVYMFGSVPGDINQDEAFAGYNAYTLLHHAAVTGLLDCLGFRHERSRIVFDDSVCSALRNACLGNPLADASGGALVACGGLFPGTPIL